MHRRLDGTVDTLERLNELFQDVFDDDTLRITPDTTARDVEDWDSLMHVTLLLTAEQWFDVRFSSFEVAGLKSVGDLIELIEDKKGQSEPAR